VAVRHADDRAAAGLEHPSHLFNGALGFMEVLDRAHRVDVDGVEAAARRHTPKTGK
jgi:hypothetical protein